MNFETLDSNKNKMYLEVMSKLDEVKEILNTLRVEWH